MNILIAFADLWALLLFARGTPPDAARRHASTRGAARGGQLKPGDRISVDGKR